MQMPSSGVSGAPESAALVQELAQSRLATGLNVWTMGERRRVKIQVQESGCSLLALLKIRTEG